MTCNKGGGDHVAPGNSGERGALLPTRVGLSLITLLTLALVALPRSASADADPPAAARAIKTLVVFTPGVDPLESRSTYDPYVRAVSTFATDSNGQPSASSIMGRLGCPLNPPTPPAGSPPFLLCQDKIAWMPYSYAGVSGGQIAPYTGVQTVQALRTSVGAMQSIVAFAQSFREVKGAHLVIVAHSLGGSIGASWGAGERDADVITLDSPVNGIWPVSVATMALYCNNSVGLIRTQAQQLGCDFFAGAPQLATPIATDLRDAEAIRQMGRAKAVNIANTADAFVPSWFAVNPATQRHAVLVDAACAEAADPFSFHHFCVLTAAAARVAGFIQTGTPPTPTPIRATINLTITLSTGTAAFDGTVTIAGANGSRTVPTVGGRAAVPVPWGDYLVQVQHAGGRLLLGALPATNQDLALEFVADSQAPRKACTPTNPASGGSTVCTLTLTSPLPVDGSLLDTVTGPFGATITGCGGETGGLACGKTVGATAIALCAPDGATSCAAGSSLTLTIRSSGGGALTEAVGVTAQRGRALIQFPVSPAPPVTFGP